MMHRRTGRAWGSVVGVLVLLSATRAATAETWIAPHGNVGGAHAVGGTQGREFGLGVQGGGGVEVALHRMLGLEAHLGGVVLSKGDPPLDPNVAEQGTGTAFLVLAGARFHPVGKTRIDGPWLSARAGFAQTGSLSRLGLNAELGWDFRASSRSRWLAGPYVGYTHVVQPDDSFRPDDARLLAAGIHVSYGRPDDRTDRDKDTIFDDEDACPDVPGVRTNDPRTNGCPERKDRDKDTIFDDEDACPDVPGVRSLDPKTNGCPPDRDGDGIYDKEDACPDVPGVRTNDPKTNGCPPDRDKDGIVDKEDACPDVPGVRTSDPKTNGCPPDKDNDGIPDADDACPEVPGEKTNDPKTNGCPPADDKVRLEGDRLLLDDVILFDIDSPRVRHASFGIIQKVADFIKKTPDILEISIEGHADATGTEEHNRVLSRERADSVVRLLERFGVEGSRLKAESFGRSRLKVNTQAAERANRRVEFYVTRSRIKGSSGATVPVKAPGEVTP
ncbi:MAG: OmpA family protein [Polyangiaceae bacterium]